MPESSLELAGPNDYDRVVISGNAELDGLLDVDLLNGYTPEVTESFTLLRYGARSGAFDDIDLPGLPSGRHFAWAYLATAFVL